MSNLSYYAKIDKLEFYVLGSEENYIDSKASVTNKELFKNDLPVPEGVYDAHFGSTGHDWLCATCGGHKGQCPGHSGSIDLKYPIKSPLFRDNILKWLKVICFKCGRLIVNKTLKVAKNRLLIEYVKLARGIEVCPWSNCQEPHPNIVKDTYEQSKFYAEYESGKKVIKKIILFNHHIKDIFGRITDETVLKMGKPLKSHPKKFIIDVFRVAPNTIRPDIRRLGGSRSNNSDITALIKNIVEINEILPFEIPPNNEIDKNLSDLYFNLDMMCYELIKGSSTTNNQVRLVTTTNKVPNSIANRIPKKTGRIRKNLMGKRVHNVGRNVISGDDTLAVDEVGIPVSVARTISIPETVRSYNKNKLSIYLMNKKNIYPGCSGIYMANSNKFYSIDYLDPTYELQEGDIIMRDIIEGDYIGFNRQPSLLFGQIGSHRVKIMEGADTFRINVSACSPYNADFDGDESNIYIAQNIQSRLELQNLSWNGNWMISYQDHSPYYGCYQDSLIGSLELTKSNVLLDKYHAMCLFSNVSLDNIDKDFNFIKNNYTGRDIISIFLPHINYPKKKANIYMPQYSPFIKYDPEEIYVQINRGELISGCLDKSTVGQGKMGSIFQVINNEYGSQIALDTIYNFQQVISRFFTWKGFSVGIRDINLSPSTIKEIKIKTKAIIEEANKITNKLSTGNLIAPIGTTLKDFYEMEQMRSLEPGDDFAGPILNDIDFKTNSLAKLIFSGSKGKVNNLMAINGSQGQATINGKRIQKNFSWERTSPYFARYDTSPRSLGFIETSFREGIESDVFPYAAAEARNGSISNALSTSVSGAQSRLNIKNLESIYTDNHRKCVKNKNIIQPLYAESGIDPRKTEKVKFLTALISDEQMKKDYHSKVQLFDKSFHNKNVQKILDNEFKQLMEDRNEYRRIHLTLERFNPKEYIMDNEHQMPINPYRIIEDVIYNNEDILQSLQKNQKILDPVKSIELVQEICNILPYGYFNVSMELKRGPLPEYILHSILLLKILIRTYLCTSNLIRKKVNNFHLKIILEKIKISFKNSLMDYGSAVGIIAAQCLSEPLTQYVLDSKHKVGVGGNKTNAIVRIKEILGAKPTEKMENVSMLIMVKEEYENNKFKVQEIANYIEMMNFERFTYSEMLFFEEYGNPVHPDFKHEVKLIKEFEKYNRGIKIPENLSKWCIRYELNKEEMFLNSMNLDTIIDKLRIIFPNIYFVYTPEKVENIIIKCYISNNMIKIPASGFSEDIIIDIIKKINTTIIRGVKDIHYTELVDVVKSYIQNDGSIASSKIYAISTIGTNLEEVLENPYIDKYRTQTDSIHEIKEMFGIEAARQKINNEIRKTMPDVILPHCTIFSSEMTYSGDITSIQKTGLQIREASNITLRLSFQSPIQVIENAAINGITDKITNISGPLVCGQTFEGGTTYNNVIINEKFVEQQMKNINNIIDDL